MDKINVQLYGGKGIFGGRETPLEAEEIYCDKYNNCSFYKENKCLKCRSFLAPDKCFGKINTIKGYTSRAAKYHSFRNKYRQDPVYDKLDYPSNSLVAVIDNNLYINTKYVDVRKATNKDFPYEAFCGYIIDHSGFGSNFVFIPMEEVSNQLLHRIFSFSPRAMMGGIIEDYQDKIVPEVLQQMKKLIPNIYNSFITEYPDFYREPNYIGKRCYIHSLKPGTIFSTNNHSYIFDGEYVESLEEVEIGLGSPWWSEGGRNTKIKIKVNDKMTIKIADNNIVDENTLFV